MTSNVPKAVRAAAKRAEEAHKAHYSTPQDTDDQKPDDPALDTQSNEDAPKAEENAAPAQPEQKPADDSGEWKRKYESLKGKYDAEIPRMAAEIRAYKAEKQAIESQVAELKQQVKDAEARKPDTSKITDEAANRIRDEYGEDFLQVVRSIAEQVVGTGKPDDEISSLKQEVSSLRQDHQKTARERFEGALQEAVPTWQKINVDPAFHAWLAEVDPMTGRMRQELLDEAAASLNANRVAAIFDAFIGPKPANPKPEAQSQQRNVSPNRSRSQEPAPTRQQYTPDDLAKLHSDYLRGKFRGNEAEYRKKEAEIHAALFGGQAA